MPKNIEFCPDHNPLFDSLTVREHYELFNILQGYRDFNVGQLIQDFGLTDKADEVLSFNFIIQSTKFILFFTLKVLAYCKRKALRFIKKYIFGHLESVRS